MEQLTTSAPSKTNGRIVSVRGSVVDAEFEYGLLPSPLKFNVIEKSNTTLINL